MHVILGKIFTAALTVFGTMLTQKFFESIMKHIIVYAAEKLSIMSTNKLDDELVKEIKKALEYNVGE